MRTVVGLSALALLCGCAQRQQKNDLQQGGLKGKVKAVTESTFDGVDKYGSMEKGALQSTVITQYNTHGNIVAQTEETPAANGGKPLLLAQYNYSYDDQQKRTEEDYTSDMRKLVWKLKYEYDDKNKEEHRFKYWGEGARLEAGYLAINQENTDTHPDVFSRIRNLNRYVSLLPELIKQQYSEGSLDHKWVVKVDKDGNAAEEAMYKDNGELLKKKVVTCDRNGNVLHEVTYHYPGNDADSIDNKYDGGNHVIERYGRFSQDMIFQASYSYDEHGNKTKEITSKPGGRTDSTTMQYQYDQQGNWVKMVDVSYSVPASESMQAQKQITVTERKIEYY